MARVSTSSQPHLESVRAMLVETLGDRLSPGVVDYADLFTETGVLEIPFGDTLRLVGRAAIRAYTDTLRTQIMLGPRTVTALHSTAGDTVVVEYHGPVENLEHGVSFRQDYISVFRLDGGRIALFREYLDPMRFPQHGKAVA